MKKLCISLLLFFSISTIYGQAIIEFKSRNYDFGTLQEAGGTVRCEFIFTNNGKTSLIINDIQTSCGCTSPEWTKTPIATGKTGSISITYNPLGRQGNFHKTISVYSNSQEKEEMLTISGNVVSAASTVNNFTSFPEFTEVIGNFAVSGKSLDFGEIANGETQTQSIKIKNQSEQSVALFFSPASNYLTVNAPKKLAAGETANIFVKFNSQKCPFWGPISDEIYLLFGNEKTISPDAKITILANVIDNFENANIENSPKIEFKTTKIDLGKLKSNAKKTVKFSFKNIGTMPLEIRRIINSNLEISVLDKSFVIKKGKSNNLKIELDTFGLTSGSYTRALTVQTNDPETPYTVLLLEWKVK